jgi:hypothetical protein
MTDLQDAVMARGELDKLIGFGERGGDGFFDKNVDAGFEECGGDWGVSAGGHADGCGVKRKLACGAGGEAGIQIAEGADARELRFQCVGAGGIAFNNGGEAHRSARCGAQLVKDAEMIAAEGAGADDGEADGRQIMSCHLRSAAALAFDDLEAACVELEQVRDLVFGLGAGWSGKAGGSGRGTADVCGGRDEFEEIEGDVFVAASSAG